MLMIGSSTDCRPEAEFGGPGAKLDEPNSFPAQVHDHIAHSAKSFESKLAEFRVLYESGLSLRAIEAQTGTSKTKIRATLLKAGIAIREATGRRSKGAGASSGMRGGIIPYGYRYLEGKLVVDPREYKIVLDVYRRWTRGESLRAISRYLNAQKIPTRKARSWKHEVVKKIIERHVEQEGKKKEK